MRTKLILVLALCTVGLVGCGKNSDTNTTPDAQSPQTATTATTTAAPAADTTAAK